METLFSCVQQVKQSTIDTGSILILIFANCQALCNVIEDYWTDHKSYILCYRDIDDWMICY